MQPQPPSRHRVADQLRITRMAPSAHGLHGTADLSLLTSEAPPIELPPPRFSHAIQGFAAVMDESLVMRVLAQESGIVEAIERDWPVRALRRLGRSAICWAAGPGILLLRKCFPSSNLQKNNNNNNNNDLVSARIPASATAASAKFQLASGYLLVFSVC